MWVKRRDATASPAFCFYFTTPNNHYNFHQILQWLNCNNYDRRMLTPTTTWTCGWSSATRGSSAALKLKSVSTMCEDDDYGDDDDNDGDNGGGDGDDGAVWQIYDVDCHADSLIIIFVTLMITLTRVTTTTNCQHFVAVLELLFLTMRSAPMRNRFSCEHHLDHLTKTIMMRSWSSSWW